MRIINMNCLSTRVYDFAIYHIVILSRVVMKLVFFNKDYALVFSLMPFLVFLLLLGQYQLGNQFLYCIYLLILENMLSACIAAFPVTIAKSTKPSDKILDDCVIF